MNELNVPREGASRIALLYPRVSDKKQDTGGSGLGSQEYRLRQYCVANGWHIERVFKEIKSAKGKFTERPEMVNVLKHIEANRHTRYVLVFDDFLRFSRDAEFYWPLKRKLDRLGVDIKSPNFQFDDSPEGKHHQTTTAAGGQLQREQIARQTRQKMQARLEQGFAVFRAPIGYVYAGNKKVGGMRLVKDERYASIVREALEGYALGRFGTQAEVQRFLESHADYPRDRNGEVHAQRVTDILTQPIYAGYIDAPQWGVSLRKAQHEPLISYEMFTRIQDLISGKAKAPAAKDLNRDFVLRGSVTCSDCETPLTAGWSSGRSAKYPYYLCPKKGCDSYGKSIRRDVLEGEFEKLLVGIQPSAQLFDALKAMFEKVWNHRLESRAANAQALRVELADVERQGKKFLERIIEVDTPSVVTAIEGRIRDLEAKKVLLQEQIANSARPVGDFDKSLRTALDFLASPWNIWNSGSFENKKLVLRLMLAERLEWVKNQGLRTAKLTFPFKVLDEVLRANFIMSCKLASPKGFEPLLPP